MLCPEVEVTVVVAEVFGPVVVVAAFAAVVFEVVDEVFPAVVAVVVDGCSESAIVCDAL